MNNKIKLCVLAFAALSASTLCQATQLDKVQICTQVADLGKQIMQARQNGVAMAKMMKVVGESDPAIRPVFTKMAEMAYDQPAYSTDRMKTSAVSEFYDVTFKSCYDQAKKVKSV